LIYGRIEEVLSSGCLGLSRKAAGNTRGTTGIYSALITQSCDAAVSGYTGREVDWSRVTRRRSFPSIVNLAANKQITSRFGG